MAFEAWVNSLCKSSLIFVRFTLSVVRSTWYELDLNVNSDNYDHQQDHDNPESTGSLGNRAENKQRISDEEKATNDAT